MRKYNSENQEPSQEPGKKEGAWDFWMVVSGVLTKRNKEGTARCEMNWNICAASRSQLDQQAHAQERLSKVRDLEAVRIALEEITKQVSWLTRNFWMRNQGLLEFQ